jgi:DNA-binding transcriptional LysR family regulator
VVTLKQLAHARALAHHRNFHAASKAENISQPALSRSIRALEEQLGVALFDRRGSTVQPTLFGEALLQRAAKVFDETDELVREIQLLQGLDAGNLTIAMGVYAAEMSASQAVGELIKRHPDLSCSIKLSSWKQVADLVLSRSVDLGIAEISTLDKQRDLQVDPVAQHAVVLFCRRGHPLAGRRRVTKQDLAPYPAATVRLPPRAAGKFPGRIRPDKETGDWLPSIEVDDLACARAVIANSDAFGVAAPLQIEPWLRSGEFIALPFQAPWLQLDYGFIYLRKRMLSPAATAFMAQVRLIEQQQQARNTALLDEILHP